MFGTFSLELTLGNEGMSDRDAVARALEALALRLHRSEEREMTHGYIRDHNGNTVGSWQLTAENDDE